MRKTRFALAGSIAVSLLASGSIAAQAAKPAAQGANPPAQTARPVAKPAAKDMPRMPDGHPDLQGTYDVATMTPVERFPGMKNLVMTPEEAAAAEKYEAQRHQQLEAPVSAERGAPPAGGDKMKPKSYQEFLEAAGAGDTGGYNSFWLSEGKSFITVDGQKRSSLVIDPAEGRIPTMNAEARARQARLRALTAAPDAAENAAAGPPGAFDGPEARPLAERCLLGFLSTAGPPSLPNYFYNNLKQIVQTPTNILIVNEMVHDARVVRMGAQHLPPTVRKWMGDSVGHWEGDTLVIDTTNFTDKTQFQGSSDQLHVVERIKRTGPQTLLYRFTVEDPQTWDRAWTGEYPWNGTDEHIYEYACHEGNYAMSNMLRGARAAEREAAAGKRH
jgi:hypothetical protein